ncbi:MAG TPA: DUF4440 domain-containing protein [Chitinophagaceae bacterium]|nr:DUF4440 domain-containing protein [Chitinophagaceae bacterium]
MKILSRAIAPALCLLAFTLFQCKEKKSATKDHSADEAAVRKADSSWAAAAGAKQLNDFMGLVLDGAVIMPPNNPVCNNPESIKTLMNGFFGMPGYALVWHADKVEVAGSGEMAYSYGNYELNFNDAAGKPMTDKGKYATIWKKQDGNWKVALDIFNSDIPLAPPTQN